MKKIHNLKVFLDFYCKKNNDNIFYLSENKSNEITYSQLLKILKNFNFLLKKYNIKKNQKILVILDNSLELLIIFLSILYNNRVFIPINPNSGKSEINYIIKKTKPSFIITSPNFKNRINDLKNKKFNNK